MGIQWAFFIGHSMGIQWAFFVGHSMAILRIDHQPINYVWQASSFSLSFRFTTKQILNTGATVYANDLSEDQLKELQNALPEDQRQRCILKPGSVLDLDFPAGSLSGVLACRFFHYLTGPQLRELFQKCFTWLEPGGKFFMTCGSPYSGRSKAFIEEYEARKAAGEEWPGSFDFAEKYVFLKFGGTWRFNSKKSVQLQDSPRSRFKR